MNPFTSASPNSYRTVLLKTTETLKQPTAATSRKSQMAWLLLLLSSFFIMSLLPTAPVKADGEGWIGVTDGLSTYAQEEDTFGGPASVKAILANISEFECEQKDIAREAGTNAEGTRLLPLLNMINSSQYRVHYKIFDKEDEEAFSDHLYESFAKWKMPVILAVVAEKTEGWPYSSGRAQYLVAYAISEDQKEVCISDPFVRYGKLDRKGIKDYYTVSLYDLYRAYVKAGCALGYPTENPAGKLIFRVTDNPFPESKVDKVNVEFINNMDSEVEYAQPVGHPEFIGLQKKVGGVWSDLGEARFMRSEKAIPKEEFDKVKNVLRKGNSISWSFDLSRLLPQKDAAAYRLILPMRIAGEVYNVYSEVFTLDKTERPPMPTTRSR